jgi:uncharacterized repeat protein (TIGR01451 family)
MGNIGPSGLVLGMAALVGATTLATTSPAFADRNYEVRKRLDQYGGVALAANNTVTCAASAACTAARANAGGTDRNNNFNGAFIDADADVTTFSSSSAELILPGTADVSWAGLYWTGDSGAADGVDRTVRFQVPGAVSYEDLNADVFDNIGNGGEYQGFEDVTAQVQAAGAGDYWVADVQSDTGVTNVQGGWSLVVIYRDTDPAARLRSVTVFDGARTYTNVAQTFNLAGFLSPIAGTVITELGIIQYDGDRNENDTVVLTSGALVTNVGDAVSPVTDVMNSTVSRGGAVVPAAQRTPAHANSLGYDADFFSLTNRLPNSSTSATLQVQASGETLYGGVIIFSTDIYIPNIIGTKSSEDLNAGNLVPGDVIEYTIDLVNNGVDAAINAQLTDAIPEGTTYVADSLIVDGTAEDDDPADAIGGYDPINNELVINLGDTPGIVAIGETITIVFRVRVDDLPQVTQIRNQADISYAGQTLGAGTTFADATDGDTGTDGDDPTDDGLTLADDDEDGIWNGEEEFAGTDPNDADSDDDGVIDGDEPAWDIDTDGDGLIGALDPDSDDDGLLDGTELGVTTPDDDTDVGAGNFVPDGDAGATTTDPLDPDTDDGGVIDGAEDLDRDGTVDLGETDPTAGNGGDDTLATDSDGDGLPDNVEITLGTDPNDADTDDDGVIDGLEPNWSLDSDGDGLINPLDPDSDDDGLFDGTEVGVAVPHPDTNVVAGHFIPDGDAGATVTSPLDPDTDDGGIKDGAEDVDHDGVIDGGEGDPNDPADDDDLDDTDGDGLPDDLEDDLGTDPTDADSDDDGVIDGQEPNFTLDSDGDGLINPLDPDSDDDGLFDGTEVGVTSPHADTDVAAGHFIPDGDAGDTTTGPLDPDTDDGGIKDGAEDLDHDGEIDGGEGDPNDPSDDDDLDDTDGDGLPDDLEDDLGTDPDDADSDDDGVIDGQEPNFTLDSDGDGLINPLDPDSDDDGLFDGTEVGVSLPHPDTDVGAGHFIPDGDGGATTTGPLDPDTDDGGIKDGAEDFDHDGVIDAGEGNPNNPADDDLLDDGDGDGLAGRPRDRPRHRSQRRRLRRRRRDRRPEPNFGDDSDGDGAHQRARSRQRQRRPLRRHRAGLRLFRTPTPTWWRATASRTPTAATTTTDPLEGRHRRRRRSDGAPRTSNTTA